MTTSKEVDLKVGQTKERKLHRKMTQHETLKGHVHIEKNVNRNEANVFVKQDLLEPT